MFTRLFLSCLSWLLTVSLAAQVPELIVPTGHTRPLLCLRASPSGSLLASSSIDETVKVWDVAAGRELTTFRPGDAARDLAFSPDEKYLAVAAFNRVHILRTDTWEEIAGYDGWWTNGVRFHPRKNELYYLTQRHNSTGEDPIKIYAATPTGGTPRLLATVDRSSDRKIPQLDLSPDGSTLLLVQEGVPNRLIPTTGGPPTEAGDGQRFTPDGDLFFLSVTGTTAKFGVRTRIGQLRWELSTNAGEVDNRDLVHGMGFDPATEKFYWNNRPGKLANGNYRTGGASMYEMPEKTNRSLDMGSRGTIFLSNDTDFLITAYAPPNLKGGSTLGEAVLAPSQLAGSEVPARLSWGRGEIKSLSFRGRQVLAYDGPDGPYAAGRPYYSSNGALLASSSGIGGGDVFAYRAADRHPEIKRFKSGFKDARTVAVSADGKRLAVVATDGYLVMSTETDKFVAKGAPLEGDRAFQEDAALSPDGTRLLLSVSRTIPGSSGLESYVRLIDVKSGNTLWQQKGRWEHPAFSADGTTIIAEIYEYFSEYAVTDGRELRRHPLTNGRFPSQTAFTNRQDWATYIHDNRGYVYDLNADREYQLTVPGQDVPYERSAFFGDGFVALAGREGVLRLFDVRSRKYVGALVRYADSEDWALVGADGRFDATPGAMKKMYYRVGRQQIALEQLFGGYFTPGLAEEIFGRLPAGSLPAPQDINQLRPAPEVSLSYRPVNTRGLIVEDDTPGTAFIRAGTQDASISIKGNAPNDRIVSIRLYRNGKLLREDATRNLIVEDDEPEPPGGERDYRVRLLPGENRFRAVAVNSQQTESRPAYLTVEYVPPATSGTDPVIDDPAPGAMGGPAGVTLHLVTVGIDRYANPGYNLNYARADADAIGRQLDGKARGLVGNIRTYAIRDDGATREAVIGQLRAIAESADADDLLVFYFAGHGMIPDADRGEFYLVPHEVTDPGSGLLKTGISATVLSNLSAAVPAERQLFVLDACQSGGALTGMNEKAIATLARHTGTHWLTATDSQQLATEFDALGHGAFTYVLLEALSGKADADTNREVTVEELRRYLERELPELTKKYGGAAQYPSSFSYGEDFAVGKR